MLVLRWVLAIACGGALAVFALILTVGKGFDAFRSADTGNSSSLLVVTIPAGLLAMLVALFLPQARLFQHIVAAAVVAAAIGCLTILKTNPGEGGLYLAFLALYLLHYALAVWMRA